MAEIGERIEQIRRLGVGFGLTDSQIDSCLLASLKQLLASTHDGNAQLVRGKADSRRSCAGRLCCALFKAALCLVVFVLCLTAVAYSCPPCEKWLTAKADPWIYTITKNWRLLTLGLTRNFDLTYLYHVDCLIRNPIADIPDSECELCRRVTKEHDLHSMSTRQYENIYMGKAQPMIVRNLYPEVNYDRLRSWYAENRKTFDVSDRRLTVAPPGVETVDELLANYTESDVRAVPDFRLEWTSDGVNPSRLLRKLFPRPDFIPDSREVNLRKSLVVLGPRAGSMEPDRSGRQSPAQWYIQGSGSRQIVLRPHQKCDRCKTVAFTLNPGDIVCYNGLVSTLESLPVTDDDKVSVAYLGSLALMF